MMTEPLLIRAYRGERGACPPLWLMRQAGRFLPEYRALRAEHSMLDLVRTPRLAAQVTLQPIERFDLDGAIIFADILTPLIGLGFRLEFVEGSGPRIDNPLRSPAEVELLTVPPVESNVGYTLEAIALAAAALRPRGVPLLGFCGAPFTLSCYLIEGGSPDTNLAAVKRFMLSHPAAWQVLQEKLVDLLAEYLAAQVKAGAAAVQIFDSWLGGLAPQHYAGCIEPYLKRLIKEVRAQTAAPIVFFSTGTAGMLEQFAGLGADCFGVDWRIPLDAANERLGRRFPLQGNLDPALLCGPQEPMLAAAADVLTQGRRLKSHIFNLGHGVLPPTPVENVEALVRLVRAEAE